MHLTNVFHFRGSLVAVVSQLGNFASSGSSFETMPFFLGALLAGFVVDCLVSGAFCPFGDGSWLVADMLKAPEIPSCRESLSIDLALVAK